MDDIIDDSVWINVQDPVKQMITAITSAVRVQSAAIRDMDRKINNTLVTNEILERTIDNNLIKVSLKSEVKDIVREMDSRTNELSLNFNNYEEKLSDISNKLLKINELLNNQNLSIINMNSKIEKLTDDINELKINPNYDPIYAYIDRQVNFKIIINLLFKIFFFFFFGYL